MKSDQLRFVEFESMCGCWSTRDAVGNVLSGHACPECVELALAYLEDLLYLDKEVSVSALSRVEAEKSVPFRLLARS